jgi:hypothetical protein
MRWYPGTQGKCIRAGCPGLWKRPAQTQLSVPLLMMEYSDRISTSLGPGSGTGTWRTSTSPGAVKTAALLVVGMKGPPARRAKETNRPALLWQVGS